MHIKQLLLVTRTAEATLTDFLRDPKAVVERLEHVDVVLHRRNAEDLRLSLESRTEAVADGVRFLACMAQRRPDRSRGA